MKIIAKTETGWLVDIHNQEISKFYSPTELKREHKKYEINESNIINSNKQFFLKGKKY